MNQFLSLAGKDVVDVGCGDMTFAKVLAGSGARVLAIDPERERISLGIKQLDQDPFSTFLADHPKGSIVKGVVTEVDARRATVELEGGIQAQLRASELSRDRVEDARTVLKIGEEIEAKFMGLDRKSRVLSLSIKAREAHEEKEAVESYKTGTASHHRCPRR